MHSSSNSSNPSDVSSVVEQLRKTPKAQLTYQRDFYISPDFSISSLYSNETTSTTFNSNISDFYVSLADRSRDGFNVSSINSSETAGNVETSLPLVSDASPRKESSPESKDARRQIHGLLNHEILWRLHTQEDLKDKMNQIQTKYSRLFEGGTSTAQMIQTTARGAREKSLIPTDLVEEAAHELVLQKKHQESRAAEELRLQQLTSRIRSMVQQEEQASELEKLRREEETRKTEQLKESIKRIDQAIQRFQSTWRTLSEAVKSCGNQEILKPQITSRIIKLKELNQIFDTARREAANPELCSSCAARCEDTLAEIVRLAGEIHSIVTKVKQEDEAKAAAATTAPSVAPQAAQKEQETFDDSLSLYVREENLKNVTELQAFAKTYESTYADLVNNPSMKQFRLDCQKAVVTPANAISNVSAEHLRDKLNKLLNLLLGNWVDVGEKRFCAAQQQGGLQFCFDSLAKKFVKQAEDVVGGKPESCFAIAAVIVRLWVRFPDFGRLLLAHLYRACPYLVPYYIPRVEGQSDEEFYKLQGYRYENGQVEKQDKFLKRMSGIARLYAAIMITPASAEHPHNLRHGWTFLADLLNLEPRPDITVTILLSFLQVAGSSMAQTYGTQFQKMLHLLCTDYFVLIKKVASKDCGGPVYQLEEFLQTSIKKGGITPPSGMLPPNFW